MISEVYLKMGIFWSFSGISLQLIVEMGWNLTYRWNGKFRSKPLGLLVTSENVALSFTKNSESIT